LEGDYSSSMQNPGASAEAFLAGRASKGKKKMQSNCGVGRRAGVEVVMMEVVVMVGR